MELNRAQININEPTTHTNAIESFQKTSFQKQEPLAAFSTGNIDRPSLEMSVR
jgi:hypothetical protein